MPSAWLHRPVPEHPNQAHGVHVTPRDCQYVPPTLAQYHAQVTSTPCVVVE
jgi:hypothetical protein